ncbi:MAG: hypothetical protein IKY23_13525 [Lachnospiraceae bacterium]|nr:hypothetical protein [Lachnospiraceae bacterium]
MKRIGLLGDYIQIKRANGNLSFGGDQNFFGNKEDGTDRKKKQFGCGVVAFADLLLYLGERDETFRVKETADYIKRELSELTYKEYFNRIYDVIGGVIGNYGISGITIFRRFNKIARKNGWRLRAKWGCSRKKLLGRMEEMLEKNIPVILCIPMMLLKKDREDKLPLYFREYDEREGKYTYRIAEKTNGHYVTVTELFYEGEVPYLRIASWGKEYYINFEEYDRFISTHFLGKILGNILYVR